MEVFSGDPVVWLVLNENELNEGAVVGGGAVPLSSVFSSGLSLVEGVAELNREDPVWLLEFALKIGAPNEVSPPNEGNLKEEERPEKGAAEVVVDLAASPKVGKADDKAVNDGDSSDGMRPAGFVAAFADPKEGKVEGKVEEMEEDCCAFPEPAPKLPKVGTTEAETAVSAELKEKLAAGVALFAVLLVLDTVPKIGVEFEATPKAGGAFETLELMLNPENELAEDDVAVEVAVVAAAAGTPKLKAEVPDGVPNLNSETDPGAFVVFLAVFGFSVSQQAQADAEFELGVSQVGQFQASLSTFLVSVPSLGFSELFLENDDRCCRSC